MPRRKPPAPRQKAIDANDQQPFAEWTSHIDYDWADPETAVLGTRRYGGAPAYLEDALNTLTDKERYVVEAVVFEGLAGDVLAARFGHKHRWPVRRIYLRAIEKLTAHLEETA